MDESVRRRSKRIISNLLKQYPGKKTYDLDGRGLHFVCEIEPVEDHPEYDRAIEVIIASKPHKHNKMTQTYTGISGTLELHSGEHVVKLKAGDTYVVKPKNIHWAKSDNEAVVEIFSKPGWSKEDHIVVD